MARLPALGYTGCDTYSIDEQGRVALPSKYRKMITGRIYVITMAPEPCLSIYPEYRWRQYVQGLMPMTFGKKDRRDFSRLLGTKTDQVTLDDQGRIKLGEKFLKHAGLQREVLIIGAMDRLEIWNPETWESYEKGLEKPYQQLAEESLDKVSLQDFIK